MPCLQLVRLPNVITALADGWAGYFICVNPPHSPDWRSLASVLVACACLYAGGVALNDLLDLSWDRVHRPERPIPSGRVSTRIAAMLVGVLFLAALVASGLTGRRSLNLCAVLVLSITLYNRCSKAWAPLAAVLMGTCRALNLLLGASAAPANWHQAWLPAALLGAYIFVVTAISRMEDKAFSPRRLIVLALLLALFPASSTLLYPRESFILGAVVILALMGMLAVRVRRACTQATPAAIGLVIQAALLGLVLFDAAAVLGRGHVAYGLACLALLVPSSLLARRMAMT
ncbi:MAG: UbiA family prenyltransferase [Planctomycetes bacterium]|nr:UbiA family prenyltransferase [Planctomycetota bacterium]